MARVLVIDDEEAVLAAVKRRLARDGHVVSSADTAAEGTQLIADQDPQFDVIVTDMSIEDPEAGLKVLQSAFTRDLFAEVIIMTAYGNVANAVECMRRGAFDYIEKNVPGVDTYEEIAMKVALALDRRRRDAQTIALWERAAKSKERMP